MCRRIIGQCIVIGSKMIVAAGLTLAWFGLICMYLSLIV